MTTQQLITEVSRKTQLNKEKVTDLLESTAEILTESLLQGKNIHIQDFGDLEVRKKNERVNVNPKTGIRTLTPPKLQLCFKQNSKLKEILLNEK
ncbi:MAG TPA: HU family DNA-binding protein [Bacteroidales bacterium]|nr:HU family DNA-binding protein [Bacteroidales bacterium]